MDCIAILFGGFAMKKFVAVLTVLFLVFFAGQVYGFEPGHGGHHGGHNYHHGGGWGFGIYTQPVVPAYPYYYAPPPVYPAYPYYYAPPPVSPGFSFGIYDRGSGFSLRVR